ncbi:hypothetical protein KQI30_13970 [Clostridium bornimense]|uniref:hypothetical protein n=1 Tax=Clostridium bornimense TaxID=1216932 RepID=UPI001C119FC0|nr:hypothetical protein [Clostridium bornimense]MBU5317359.1 hypothetical protein [Clostridium bornimense]
MNGGKKVLKWFKKKKGSSMLMVLVISIALIFILGGLMMTLTKTNTYNQKYNTNNDLRFASKSGLNIGRSELITEINKIKDIDKLQEKYVFDEKVKEIVGNDKYQYSVTATLDKDKSMYKLVSIVTNKKGVSMKEMQNVYLNLNNKYDISSLVGKMNIFSVLGNEVPSITISTTNGTNPSKVPPDIWYVESLETDLNNKSYININNNYYTDDFVNGYKAEYSKVAIRGINGTKKGVWNSPLNMLIDDAHKSLEVYSQDGSGDIIGYRKKIGDVKVVLLNGDINITDGSYEFKDTILYVTGNINLNVHDLRLNNSMIIAGGNLNLKTICIIINSKPSYSNIEEIQKFIGEYNKE